MFGLFQTQPSLFLAPAVIALLTDAGRENSLGNGVALTDSYFDVMCTADDARLGLRSIPGTSGHTFRS